MSYCIAFGIIPGRRGRVDLLAFEISTQIAFKLMPY